MTIDEVLDDYKKHGDDWPEMVLHKLLLTHGKQVLGEYNDELYSLLRTWVEQMVIAGVAATAAKSGGD
jgi:hypothetical protein